MSWEVQLQSIGLVALAGFLGGEYERYRQRTPMLVPLLRLRRKAGAVEPGAGEANEGT